MPVNVAIIEDQKEIREMLSVIIRGYQDFNVVGEFQDAEEAIQHIPNSKAHVVLVDIHLPGVSGIECVAGLKKTCPEMQFIMCTSIENTETIFAALKAGATGYLSKTTPPSKILEAITEVYQGGSPMSSHIARKVVCSFAAQEENEEIKKLTSREREILELLSKGLRYKEIASQLFLSTETIRTHARNIYEKLQVNSSIMAINKIYGSK